MYKNNQKILKTLSLQKPIHLTTKPTHLPSKTQITSQTSHISSNSTKTNPTNFQTTQTLYHQIHTIHQNHNKTKHKHTIQNTNNIIHISSIFKFNKNKTQQFTSHPYTKIHKSNKNKLSTTYLQITTQKTPLPTYN